MVAKKLDKKLRDNLFDARNNLFQMDTSQAGGFNFQRPILIILGMCLTNNISNYNLTLISRKTPLM